jgi:hypothetical protein
MLARRQADILTWRRAKVNLPNRRSRSTDVGLDESNPCESRRQFSAAVSPVGGGPRERNATAGLLAIGWEHNGLNRHASSSRGRNPDDFT